MTTTATASATVQDVYRQIELVAEIVKNSYRPLKSFLPVGQMDRTALELLAVTHNSTLIDISSANGEPVDIPTNATTTTIPVVRFAGRTSKAVIDEYMKPGVAQVKFDELYNQFVMNEEKLICDTLTNNTNIPTVDVDTTSDTNPPSIQEIYSSIMSAVRSAKSYGIKNVILLIAEDVSQYLTQPIGDNTLTTIAKELDDLGIEYIITSYLSNCAYVIPINSRVIQWVELSPSEVKIAVDYEDMAWVYGRETVAVPVLQPKLITKLNLATV